MVREQFRQIIRVTAAVIMALTLLLPAMGTSVSAQEPFDPFGPFHTVDVLDDEDDLVGQADFTVTPRNRIFFELNAAGFDPLRQRLAIVPAAVCESPGFEMARREGFFDLAGFDYVEEPGTLAAEGRLSEEFLADEELFGEGNAAAHREFYTVIRGVDPEALFGPAGSALAVFEGMGARDEIIACGVIAAAEDDGFGLDGDVGLEDDNLFGDELFNENLIGGGDETLDFEDESVGLDDGFMIDERFRVGDVTDDDGLVEDDVTGFVGDDEVDITPADRRGFSVEEDEGLFGDDDEGVTDSDSLFEDDDDGLFGDDSGLLGTDDDELFGIDDGLTD